MPAVVTEEIKFRKRINSFINHFGAGFRDIVLGNREPVGHDRPNGSVCERSDVDPDIRPVVSLTGNDTVLLG